MMVFCKIALPLLLAISLPVFGGMSMFVAGARSEQAVPDGETDCGAYSSRDRPAGVVAE